KAAPAARKPTGARNTGAALKPAKADPVRKPAREAAVPPKAPHVSNAPKPAPRNGAGDAGGAKSKHKAAKLVRDSFTMPEDEYSVLGEVKRKCLKAGIEVKKSELLRIGVSLIRDLEPAQLKKILAGLPSLKAGRPRKDKGK